MVNPTPKVSARYGAPMGRHSADHLGTEQPLYLRHCPLNAGGYDKGGAYWGRGQPLHAVGDGSGWVYFRARDRADAKATAIRLVSMAEGCDPHHVRFKR